MDSIDLHIDYPWQCYKASAALALEGSSMLQCDFPRMDKGGLAKFIAALYLSDGTQTTLGVEKSWNAILNQARTATHPSGRVLLALEGGRLLDEKDTKLSQLAEQYKLVYLTITHNFNSSWADSATDKLQHNGLTARGKSICKHAEKLGVYLDVSHSSDQTALDVLTQATKPVLATHSGVRNLVDHPRNLSDFLIKEIVGTGGLIGIPYATRFVKDSDGVVEALDYIVQLVGNTDHVAVGSDFDGAATVVPDVSQWSEVLGPLTDLGYSSDDLAKIKGGNFWRLMNGGN